MKVPSTEQLVIESLGECTVPSPLVSRQVGFVDDDEGVIVSASVSREELGQGSVDKFATFEKAGPRKTLFFKPVDVVAGIVTCGGLCPGVNDVIRSLTLTLLETYGVRRVIGFRYGYRGIAQAEDFPPMELSYPQVQGIQEMPGTLLGSSRGPQDSAEMVDTLVRFGVNVLFTIGGDGTLRGAKAIVDEVKRRGVPISVIGVPKTIDNDLAWTQRSFGFMTAVENARSAVIAGHSEACGALNGVGIVKLMGRHSGFVAAHVTLATSIVDFCLVPEIKFSLAGQRGFFKALERRLDRRRHALIVVAEGAGQELFSSDEEELARDASGNLKLKDIGLHLKEELKSYFSSIKKEVSIKYIDPSYIIRSLPATAADSEYCVVLGQSAVHAAMAGRTGMVISFWNANFTHLPIPVAVEERKQLQPEGMVWQAVLGCTGQPASME